MVPSLSVPRKTDERRQSGDRFNTENRAGSTDWQAAKQNKRIKLKRERTINRCIIDTSEITRTITMLEI